MSILTPACAMLLFLPAVTLAAAMPLEQAFCKLTKNALGQPVETHELSFPTFHPQGMTAVNDRFFLSSVEVIDRTAEQGTGHLFEMSRQGTLLRSLQLGEGALYHPGGIDYDGVCIWVPVAAIVRTAPRLCMP